LRAIESPPGHVLQILAMNNIDQFAVMLMNTWAKKSLEELRVEAEREATGISFESVRADKGQRFMLVLCATDIDQIALLERRFNFVDDGISEDWNAVTLADLAMRLFRNGGGLRFESRRDEYGRRTALALVAIDPDSIRQVESIFTLPP
jgi:hypothetical protein